MSSSRKGALARTPPSGYNTPGPIPKPTSVYDLSTIRKDTPSDSKRHKPDFDDSIRNVDENNPVFDGSFRDVDANQLIIAIGDLTALVNTLVEDNRLLKKDLSDIKALILLKSDVPKPISNERLLYSQCVASSNKTLIINPVSDAVSPADNRNIIKTKLKPSDYKICGVSNSKKGGVIIQCPSSAERDKLKTDAASQLGSDFVLSVPTKILPRVRVFGFSVQYNSDELVEIIKEQNSNLFSEDAHVNAVHIFQAKKNQRFGAKLEVDPSTFKKLIEAEKICIGWNVCAVQEDLNIRRCFKCWGFDHVASKCVANIRCPKCGDSHSQDTCDSTSEKCAVCSDAVAKFHLKIDTNHTIFSTSCSSLNHRISQERRRIDYGQ